MVETLDLPSFNQVKVLVFGDLMLDRYWSGASQRISPEAPVPVVKVGAQNTRPGGAANVALNLSSIGCQVALLGVVGKDEEALDLTSQLEANGVDCYFHYLLDGKTISKLRVLARHQQMLRLDFEPSWGEFDATNLHNMFQQRLKEADIVLFSDYGKGTLRNIAEFIAAAKGANVPVLVDPKNKDFSIYAGASLITPNLSEFEAVVGLCGQDQDLIVTKAKALMRAHHFEAILITRGQAGMSLVFADERQSLHLSTHAREVFDVTGAGDTVIALMGAAIAGGLSWRRATYLANLAAGIVVGKLGTAYVSAAEIRHELRHVLGVNQGVLTEDELLSIVQDAKDRGETIVMTNGCFDILHPGHVQYLSQAKVLGDRLLVAVNTDESVRQLKGSDRPVNELAARMEVLAALRAVDWVVAFSEQTPARLIAEVLPDILVKGGDYQAEQIVGYDVVKTHGGDVVVLPFREGYSTTGLVEKLKGD